MVEQETTAASREVSRRDQGKRILLVLGLVMQLIMCAAGLWPAAWVMLHGQWAGSSPARWTLLILAAVLVFNYGYLLALLVFRWLIPRPRPGQYTMSGADLPALLAFMLNVSLVKARHDPPWAAMFSSVLANVPPLGPFFRRWFGPHTTSATLGDTVRFLDPTLVEAGRNVQFGFDCTIICHHFDNRGMTIAKVRIGDNVVVGGQSLLMAGVEVGEGAVIGARSTVMPFTHIGPHEFWAGSPARKVKDLAGESAEVSRRIP
ncbi:MAG: hypothetical protein GXY55_21295 [Phycisphaerae bacterium]|nr:hypothetical protein [Phycisphaerae bacterium]